MLELDPRSASKVFQLPGPFTAGPCQPDPARVGGFVPNLVACQLTSRNCTMVSGGLGEPLQGSCETPSIPARLASHSVPGSS